MRSLFPLCALVASIIVLPAWAGSTEANAAPDTGMSSVVASSSDTERAMNYWTPDRMRQAKPMPIPKIQPAQGNLPKPE